MPRVNIWLPDGLHQAVKSHDLPISQICQQALREEIEASRWAPVLDSMVGRREPTTNRRRK